MTTLTAQPFARRDGKEQPDPVEWHGQAPRNREHELPFADNSTPARDQFSMTPLHRSLTRMSLMSRTGASGAQHAAERKM